VLIIPLMYTTKTPLCCYCLSFRRYVQFSFSHSSTSKSVRYHVSVNQKPNCKTKKIGKCLITNYEFNIFDLCRLNRLKSCSHNLIEWNIYSFCFEVRIAVNIISDFCVTFLTVVPAKNNLVLCTVKYAINVY